MSRTTLIALASLLSLACATSPTCGDCNLDGVVNILDGLTAARGGAGMLALSAEQASTCDINDSGSVNVLDALTIAQHSAGIATFGLSCPNLTTDWVLHTPESSPSPRAWTGLAHDAARGVTVLFGGDTGYVGATDTWEWDGSGWTLKSSSGPGAGYSYGAPLIAYDAMRAQVVVWDAVTAQLHGWNGTAWGSLGTTNMPAMYSDAQLEFDAVRGNLVLLTDSGLYGNSLGIYELVGTNWVERTSPVSPPARYGFSSTYDTNRGLVIVYGGQDYVYGYSNQVWTWDGNTWAQAPSVGAPAGGYWQDVTYDEGRQAVVLVGGWHCPTDGRSFSWDGNTWTEFSLGAFVGTRERHTMVYDSTQGESMLFGGHDWPGAFLNDTWTY